MNDIDRIKCHKPVEALFGDGLDCVWCGDQWPCVTYAVAETVARAIMEDVRPSPVWESCEDMHMRESIADTIEKDWLTS